MRRYVVLLAVVSLLMVALAVPAFAAPQGQVERGPEHAKSLCSFSGLNDDPDDPVEGGQTQSYGQEVKKGNEVPSDGAAPGFACNPNNIPLK